MDENDSKFKFDLKDLFIITIMIIGICLAGKAAWNFDHFKLKDIDGFLGIIGFILFYICLPYITLRHR